MFVRFVLVASCKTRIFSKSWQRRSIQARPIPVALPVTMAVFPFNPFISEDKHTILERWEFPYHSIRFITNECQ